MAFWKALAPAVLLFVSLQMASAQPIPVILDTDMGDDIDDALALSFALRSPELKILAINTVLQHGQRRADLTWKILKLHDRTEIPIGVGAEQPLLGKLNTNPVTQTSALGADEQQPVKERRNGLRLLIDTCLNAPGKVTILAYGPLTNVALALRSEPKIREKIDRIVLMNGVFYKPGIEYNTVVDAEASAIVYSSGLPIVTVGLDVTMQCRMTPEDLAKLDSSTKPTAQFLMKLIRIWQNGKPQQYPILHDPLSIAVAFQPELVKLEKGQVELELKGERNKTYGMTLFRQDQKGTVEVAREVQSRKFIDLFLSRLQ